jgi:hypothetical protein
MVCISIFLPENSIAFVLFVAKEQHPKISLDYYHHASNSCPAHTAKTE